MKNLIFAAALAGIVAIPTAASAQALPAAVVAVVDQEKITSQCTACKSAIAVLQGQVNALKAREQALATPLTAEGKSIQAAIDALKGKEPDAALEARIKAFQTKQQAGQQELAQKQQQIQRNQAYISQQINAKLGPIFQQVMQQRRANIMMEVGATLASASSLDVTNDVLTALNAALPSVVTTAPAAPAQQQPQGR
jgi:Skp family chaperone for outer membrane proteins